MTGPKWRSEAEQLEPGRAIHWHAVRLSDLNVPIGSLVHLHVNCDSQNYCSKSHLEDFNTSASPPPHPAFIFFCLFYPNEIPHNPQHHISNASIDKLTIHNPQSASKRQAQTIGRSPRGGHGSRSVVARSAPSVRKTAAATDFCKAIEMMPAHRA